jgi:hypothetical protein
MPPETENIFEVKNSETIQEFESLEITEVIVKRSLLYKSDLPKPGNIWYKYSFVRGNVKVSSAIQVTTAWEEANDVVAYIKKTYIYQRQVPIGKVLPAKPRKPKRQFDSRARTQN